MKPKEALVKDGFLSSAGRGRLSADAKNRLTELVNQGWDIEGYSPRTALAAVKPTKSVKSKPAKADGKVIQDFVIFWPIEEYRAVQLDGKDRSMKEVCYSCRVSLVQCHCGSPKVVSLSSTGHTPVRIERR